jgi:uncharacterized membrane protein HdeD (DUF308 family)
MHIIFGVYAIIEGLVLIASALYVRRAPELGDCSNAAMPPGGWLIVLGEGVLSSIAGLLCLFIPRLSAQVSLYVVGVLALVAGALLIVQGWLDRPMQEMQEMQDEATVL